MIITVKISVKRMARHLTSKYKKATDGVRYGNFDPWDFFCMTSL